MWFKEMGLSVQPGIYRKCGLNKMPAVFVRRLAAALVRRLFHAVALVVLCVLTVSTSLLHTISTIDESTTQSPIESGHRWRLQPGDPTRNVFGEFHALRHFCPECSGCLAESGWGVLVPMVALRETSSSSSGQFPPKSRNHMNSVRAFSRKLPP